MTHAVAHPLAPARRIEGATGEPTQGSLRFLTCGSVDDGKSTLIGRLLFDADALPRDQLATLARDSQARGLPEGQLDYSLLLDGLEAEREQGITIDVAYRFFATERRRFIVADTPGHEQYTRNMATGASTCELAVVLVDARRGIVGQTLRHTQIAALMGIRHVVLAINKMDLVGFDAAIFAEIQARFRDAAARHGLSQVTAIPLSARDGDNVRARSLRSPWYDGPTLLDHLESVEVKPEPTGGPFRMPVQSVIRHPNGRRAYAGTIARGVVRVGDPVIVGGAPAQARAERIVTFDGDRPSGEAGDAISLVLDREIDVSRGDVLADAAAPVTPADQLSAMVLWLADAPLFAGRPYIVKIGTRSVAATVTRVRHRLDVETGARASVASLGINDVGSVNLSLASPVAFEPFEAGRDLGGLILIDRLTNATVGVGMIDFALRRATNLTWHATAVTAADRARLKDQRPAVVWLTGLSGSGKSTIVNLVERRLHAEGRHTYVLDGDNVRHGLNRDLGFTEADRVENIRRASEVAALMADAGLIVLVSFISPYRTDRDMARSRMGAVAFLEVFVDTPVDECRRRDPKGLYARADRGEIANFTGVSAPYEVPEAPDLILDTTREDAETLALRIVEALRTRRCIP